MSHILKTNHLTVVFQDPNSCPNKTFRFDRAGFITQVILDDDIRFCASEPRNLQHPSSGGRGFCFVNKLFAAEDVDVGAYFPILGIGLIRRPDENRISQFLRYDEGFLPYEIITSMDENSITYEVLPKECNGFAVHEIKRFSVIENRIILEATMENVGKKELKVMEYGHNFISIDGMAIGPDYKIEIPGLPDMSGITYPEAERGGENNFIGEGSGFRMKQYRPEDYSLVVPNTDYSFNHPLCWRILHEGAGAYVSGKEHINLSRVKFWSCDHMVCPEIYQNFDIEPGAAYSWSRELEFGTL